MGMTRIRRWGTVCLLLSLAACGADTAGPDDGGSTAMPPDDDGPVALTDAQVYARAMAAGTWTWYKNSPDTLSPGGNSPHFARLRTRFNVHAATQLDAAGKVKEAILFPDSSIIVKEVYQNGVLALVAVMLKAGGDPNAGHGDWLWGEYRAGGQVVHSITQDNGSCHNCHITGIDHTRMNDSHP